MNYVENEIEQTINELCVIQLTGKEEKHLKQMIINTKTTFLQLELFSVLGYLYLYSYFIQMWNYFYGTYKYSKRLFRLKSLRNEPSLNYSKLESDKKCSESKSISQLIRHNFHPECEEGLNEQINCELYASYTYFCMANCLSKPDVALFGFAQFFKAASLEEQEHARKLVEFINMRGGSVQLCDVLKPESGDFHDPEVALEESISLEKFVLKSIEELHKKATTHNDLLLTDLLESQFIPEQYKGLQQLGEMLTSVRRAGPGMGLLLLDLDMLRHPPTSHAGNS